ARRRADPRVKIVCVDPRKTMTAEYSDYHMSPRPGSDLLLLWAMAHVMFHENLLDRKFVAAHVAFACAQGEAAELADFETFLEDYAPETVSLRLGLSEAQIRE